MFVELIASGIKNSNEDQNAGWSPTKPMNNRQFYAYFYKLNWKKKMRLFKLNSKFRTLFSENGFGFEYLFHTFSCRFLYGTFWSVSFQ